MTKKTYNLYNLEFPSWCSEINISGYRFYRVKDYKEKLLSLSHIVGISSEFKIRSNTGNHAITAKVDCPKNEPKSILKWAKTNTTSLQDILLLLSLFTGRDVFIEQEDETNIIASLQGQVIVSDPRQYSWGGILRCSIPFEKKDIEPEPYDCNIGFEKGMNQIYKLMQSVDWQDKYHSGFFLFLLRAACRRQILESSFIQCWTIWEHLFSILNQAWLSTDQIRKLNSVEKISFILVEYALIDEITSNSKKRISTLANIRNRLIHFGQFPEINNIHNDAILFIRLTEFISAKILGLFPSNVFNTMERLEEFLNDQCEK